ncbi:hypothetical protein KFK09_001644 [Dendrobium nobile]|uniref:Uncharacterized protein n=1 Tax=Dendrobium nobile TaxID=94219 RepID=A0A8T3C805_DENNO|nr:hypothetical protein KFK09_001644 [Dendrobium nobile]
MNQRNLDACEKKKEKTMELKANNRNSDSFGYESNDIALITRQFKSFLRKKHKHHQNWRKDKDNKYSKGFSDVVCFEFRKPEHVRADCPTLQDHSSKENGEEKPKFRKDKKRLQKAFWADYASDSSETEPEDETTNLCLMVEDHLDQSDKEEVSQLMINCSKFVRKFMHHTKKLKKTHASLKLELLNIQKEHKIILKDHSTIDSNHMALLDEFDELNKKHSESIDKHDALKASHTSLEFDFKKSEEMK